MKLLVFACIMALMVSMIKADFSSEERPNGFRIRHNRHRHHHQRYIQEPSYPQNAPIDYPNNPNGYGYPNGPYPPAQ